MGVGFAFPQSFLPCHNEIGPVFMKLNESRLIIQAPSVVSGENKTSVILSEGRYLKVNCLEESDSFSFVVQRMYRK